MLKRDETAFPTLKEPLTLYMKVHATIEFGEGPDWARVTLTQKPLRELFSAKRLCEEKGLEAVVLAANVDWNQEEEFRLSGHCVRVETDAFRFSARPRQVDYDVETDTVWFNDLEMALAHQDALGLQWHQGVLIKGAGLPDTLIRQGVLTAT